MGNRCCSHEDDLSVQYPIDGGSPKRPVFNKKKQLFNAMPAGGDSSLSTSRKRNNLSINSKQIRDRSVSRGSRSFSQSGYSRNSQGGQIIDDFSHSELSMDEQAEFKVDE